MYKNKIIDKALDEAEKRKEDLVKEREKKTFNFMEKFFGSDYRESFKEVRFEDYDFPFFEPIGYEGIVFYVNLTDDDELDDRYQILEVSGSKVSKIFSRKKTCFTNILDFSLEIKDAFDTVEREKRKAEGKRKNKWISWILKRFLKK